MQMTLKNSIEKERRVWGLIYLGCLGKQVQNDEGKVVGMAIRIAKLISNRIENKVATFCVHSHYKVSKHLSSCFNLEYFYLRTLVNLC